ncbi:MAG: FAD-binding oxidoreductase [Rhodospirillaceae bacterium]|nr:FAD-binding oxidoreductase [Rhodospirillaceae bacterium]
MHESFDVVVVGGGLVGASTAFHLAALSKLKVALVERGQICSGGTASSCAIVRTHYSVPSNVELTVQSLKIFDEFPTYLDDPEADSGFVRSGYLILADEGTMSEKLIGNMRMQGEFTDTHAVSHREALELHPLLDLSGIDAVGHEPRSGYADPYLTTSGFERAARRRGVTIMTDRQVERLCTDGMRVTGVETNLGVIHAGFVVCAIGPWTRMLTDPLGIETHLEVSRHTVLTLRSDDTYGRLLPVIKDLSTENKMYFRPSTGGVVLVGTGDYGDPIVDPDTMSEALDDDFVLLQGGQIARRMPSFADAALVDSWVGAYDITPDWNPVLGAPEGWEQLALAYGFSGHGFKLAPAVGKVLAQTVLGEAPDVDIAAYHHGRFQEGSLLTGTYGIGSIS